MNERTDSDPAKDQWERFARRAFTTEEIALEERRMARERWRRRVWKAVMYGGIGVLSAANLILIFGNQDTIRPVATEAFAPLPGAPPHHWQFLLAMLTFWTIIGPLVSAWHYYHRRPPDTEEWTMTALRRLTWRGGLYEEADE